MTTFQASGAGQAIEDGFILASVLSQPSVTHTTLPAALQAYDDVRRPFAQTVQERSRENGDISHLRRCGWEDVSAAQSAAGGFPREKLVRVGEEIDKMMNWAIDGTITEDRERAITLVKELTA